MFVRARAGTSRALCLIAWRPPITTPSSNTARNGVRFIVRKSNEGEGHTMIIRKLATAVALTFALSSVVAPAAYAEQTASQFRTVAPRAFSGQELQSYGLTAQDSAQIEALQAQGYQVQVIGADEANRSAGQMSTMWWIIGAVVVVAIIVAVADN